MNGGGCCHGAVVESVAQVVKARVRVPKHLTSFLEYKRNIEPGMKEFRISKEF